MRTQSRGRRTLVGFSVVATIVAAMAPGLLAGTERAAAATTTRRVAAWLPWWDQARAYQSFAANADLYSELSPFWYEMRSAAEVVTYANAEDMSVVDGARSLGVKVVPTVSNDFDGARVSTMLASSTSRAAHADALVSLVVAKGYDGIDVDYENLPAGDRDRFTAFIAILGNALRAKGKLLSIAVHPKTEEPGSWSGPQAQDWKALGSVVDRFRVMAYDYHWNTSPAGPVAPVGWVDQVAKFAASQVTPSKVQLGMPFYGYDWVGTAGEGVTHELAESRRTANAATRQWSSEYGAPWFSYTKDKKSHEVWYEDAQSIAAKLPSVDRYGLAGAVFWRLGGEDAGVWMKVREALGSTTTAPAADTTPPTAPSNLSATAIGARKVALAWTGSSDEAGGSGLDAYIVYRARSNGSFVAAATTSGTTLTDARLRRNATYTYYVVARDRAGNVSAASTRVTVTVQ